MRFLRPRFFARLLPAIVLPAASGAVLEPFTTDGCSLFPDHLPGKGPYCECCVQHDLAYWRGGTALEREKADEAFRACVARSTHDELLARAMYFGVRTGGDPRYHTSFRWGYGWPYGRNYAPLTAEESARADALEREYRAAHPALTCP
jgi:hypothetical protein